MSFRLLTFMFGCLGFCASYGCTTGEVNAPIYETCFNVENCVFTAELCEELTVDFAGVSYTNAICTLTCGQEGPVSPNCPRALIGRNGSCYPSSVAGGPDDTPVCFEPCDVDGDCLCGFRCLNAEDLCPASGLPCPIADDDAICVPGPNDCFF